jgi:5-methylcytosine-specific restriction endonuclease McrA
MSRGTKVYKEFREKVLERDGHKCQYCGAAENLQVHHIFPYESLGQIRTDVSNGQTLCKKCHDSIHGWRKHES